MSLLFQKWKNQFMRTELLNTFKSSGMITLIYSILVFTIGFLGFLIKGSTHFLLMGGGFGLLLLYTSITILLFRKWAIFLGCALTILLDAFFIFHFVKSPKIFPSAIMIAMSSLAAVSLSINLSKILKKPIKKIY